MTKDLKKLGYMATSNDTATIQNQMNELANPTNAAGPLLGSIAQTLGTLKNQDTGSVYSPTPRF